MKSKKKIQEIIQLLSTCHDEIEDETEKREIQVVISVLKGDKKSGDFEGGEKKYADLAEKWMTGKYSDEILFG